jgi:hypothetical protein
MSSEFIAQLNKALQNKQVEEVIDLERRFLKNKRNEFDKCCAVAYKHQNESVTFPDNWDDFAEEE